MSYTPDRANLTPEQTQAAVADLVKTYPVSVKTDRDEPIRDQGLGLLSFNLFDEPRVTKNNKKVYGFVKLRGNCPGNPMDASVAQRNASEIIRTQDSRHRIGIAPVGTWIPITTDDDAYGEKVDVRMKDEEIHLRDEAAKEKAKKDKEIIRELAEKAEDLRREAEENRDVDARQDSLDYYTKKRFTEDQVYQWVRSKEKDLEEFRQKLVGVRTDLYNLSRAHPEYEEQWLAHMNKVRSERGIPDYIPNELHEENLKEWLSTYQGEPSTSQ
jgi:hypothetical protein